MRIRIRLIYSNWIERVQSSDGMAQQFSGLRRSLPQTSQEAHVAYILYRKYFLRNWYVISYNGRSDDYDIWFHRMVVSIEFFVRAKFAIDFFRLVRCHGTLIWTSLIVSPCVNHKSRISHQIEHARFENRYAMDLCKDEFKYKMFSHRIRWHFDVIVSNRLAMFEPNIEEPKSNTNCSFSSERTLYWNSSSHKNHPGLWDINIDNPWTMLAQDGTIDLWCESQLGPWDIKTAQMVSNFCSQ